MKAEKVKLMFPSLAEGMRLWVKARELSDNWNLVIYQSPKEFSGIPPTQGLQQVVCYVLPRQTQLMLTSCLQ